MDITKPVLLIAGCGDVGSRLGERLAASGWCVHGLRRRVAALPPSILALPGDLENPQCPADWPAGRIDYLVYCAAASRHDEAGYRAAYVEGLRHVLDWLSGHGQRPRRLLFVSSTGVYGQRDGEWVDEDSPTEPQGFSGQILLEAERLALHSGLPASVVRLAGLYGPGRERLIEQVRRGAHADPQRPLYANRIHSEDAAGLLAFLLEAAARGVALADCYLGGDDEPAPLHEVVAWLRGRLGVSGEGAESIGRRGGSKRCRNARARRLGWVPGYPGYREGYAALLSES